MALGTSNRDGGKTSESGHLRAIYKGLVGEVLAGLNVSQRGAGANMSVDIATGDIVIPRSDGTYGHASFNDAVYNQAIAAADVSNPRRDIVVIYIDYSQTPSSAVSNNTNGVVKIAVVAGTPAGSPTDPSDAAIQSAVGASNPYSKLARVRVGAGATSIGTSVIDDLRNMAHFNTNGGWKNLGSAWDLAAYSAWDSTNKLATVNVPDSSILTLGQKFRYWQLTGGWKYGFVVKIVSSTQIILYQGTDYTLNNERIYLPGYSREQAPDGFPRDPDKWTVSLVNALDKTATLGAGWTNIDSVLTINFPIGIWNWTYEASLYMNRSGTEIDAKVTLSDANNTESDPNNTCYQRLAVGSNGSNTIRLVTTVKRSGVLAVTTPKLYYLNANSPLGTSTISIYGSTGSPTKIKAVSAYL